MGIRSAAERARRRRGHSEVWRSRGHHRQSRGPQDAYAQHRAAQRWMDVERYLPVTASTSLIWAAAACLVTAGSVALVLAQTGQDRGRPAQEAAAEIHVLKVRQNVFMLSGAGGN